MKARRSEQARDMDRIEELEERLARSLEMPTPHRDAWADVVEDTDVQR